MTSTATVERDLVFRSPDFPLDVSTWENHPDYPMVTNDFCEISIILSGTAFKMVGAEEYPLQAGDVFALSGGTAHGYRATRNLKVINVIYDASLLEQVKFDADQLPGYQNLFYEAPGSNHYRVMHLDIEQLQEVNGLSNIIEKELHPGSVRRKAVRYQDRNETAISRFEPPPPDRGCHFMAMAHFMLLVGRLARWRFHKPVLVSEKSMNIARALDYLERHFSEPLDPEALARRVGMSPRNFHRIFLSITGQTPMARLQEIRIRKAAHLLQTTDKSITEIALSCGHEDGSYFSRCFKGQMGMSPRQFRTHAATTADGSL